MELLLEALGMSKTNLEGKPSIFEVAKRKRKVEEETPKLKKQINSAELMPKQERVVKTPGAPKKS